MGHAVLTNSIVKNLEDSAPHGFAQDCSLYSANSGNNKALQWALDKGCTVISQSFHRDSENNGATIQSDDMLKDWMVLHFPHPFISQAAGNIDNGQTVEYVNHKGFNSINAGNHNDDASAMATDSSSRNPSSLHGDRELPEICANGTSVTANGYSMSGTSFAAPAVAGSGRVLLQTLLVWPLICSSGLYPTGQQPPQVMARRSARHPTGHRDPQRQRRHLGRRHQRENGRP